MRSIRPWFTLSLDIYSCGISNSVPEGGPRSFFKREKRVAQCGGKVVSSRREGEGERGDVSYNPRMPST